ncbi:MAG: hypothetical protein JW782_00370 [Candidatus Saganbacteria bacterium]|nr:hypothetical protein [Candidatus Saganbacteria bacterium]
MTAEAVRNMQIHPLANRTLSAAAQAVDRQQLRRSLVRFNQLASPRSYCFQNPMKFATGLLVLQAVAIGAGTATALISGMETYGTVKEIRQVRKLPPEIRSEAPKGCLAARAVGWIGLLASMAMVPVAMGGGAVAAIFVLTLGASLLTLGVEKVVRMVGWRRAANEVVNSIRSEADREVLNEVAEEVSVSERAQKILNTRLERAGDR